MMKALRPADAALSLVADVGGTNTRVALADGAVLRAGSIARYRNAAHPGLGAVIAQYLAEQEQPDCDAVCAAVAGPVDGDTARMTNLAWDINVQTLAEAAQAETAALLNDLQAQGYGIAHTPQEKLRTVLEGEASAPDATRLVVGVGTGFNITAVHTLAGRRIATAAEAGHAGLPVQTAEDQELAQHVGRAHGFADVEEVLSGRGVETLYAWVSDRAGQPARLSATDILQGFVHKSDPHSIEAARLFCRFLGMVAGDLALIHLPFGGLYFSGGVARAFAPYLAEMGFVEAFTSKGRFSDLARQFPVRVIEDDFAALAGCAGYLAETLGA